MGRGNWFAGHTRTPQALVYFDLSAQDDQLLDEEGNAVTSDAFRYDVEDMNWDEFLCHLGELLPDSFVRTERGDWQLDLWYGTYGFNDSTMLFHNHLLAIMADPQGDNCHVGISIVPLPLEDSDYASTRRQMPFALRHLGMLEDRLWPAMHAAGYRMSVRTSAWTCAPYRPHTAFNGSMGGGANERPIC